MPQTIVIPYSPHSKQAEVHSHPARFKVIAAGRRSGKTTLAINELIRQAVSHPDAPGLPVQRSWYICDTYKHAEMIAWKAFFKYCPEALVKVRNVHKLMVELVNGHVIEFKGSEEPDRLRGVALVFVVLDEYGFMKPEVWGEVIRPSLIDMKGSALFIGTPGADGCPHFHDLFLQGKKQEHGFNAWTFFSTDNPAMDPAEIEQARQEMPPDIFKREFEADFSSTAGLIYDNFRHSVHVVPSYEPQPTDFVVGSIDPGLHNPTGALLCAWTKEGVGIVFKEYYVKDKLASENAQAIKKMSEPYKVAYWVIDRASAHRDPASGITVADKYREHLRTLIYAKNDPHTVWSGIDEVKKLFHVNPITGKPRLFITAQCHWTQWEIGRYIRYKHKWAVEKNEEEKPRKLNDHLLDALRNMVMTQPWKRVNFSGIYNPNFRGY